MGRRSISIDEKIERAKEHVFKCKDKYDEALAELVALQEKKSDQQKQELLEAMENSSRSYEDILKFLEGK